MKPSTSPLISGVGSKSTGTISSSLSSMPFAASSALKTRRVGVLHADLLALEVVGSRDVPAVLSERIVKGFFWNVVPMIFSGASCSATAAPTEAASLRANCTDPRQQLRDAGVGARDAVTSEKPASS